MSPLQTGQGDGDHDEDEGEGEDSDEPRATDELESFQVGNGKRGILFL